MVIAAKTGQGKTLTFALPIIDMLMKRVHTVLGRLEEDQSSSDQEDQGKKSADPQLANQPKKQKRVFDSVKSLIISPTRELALQIKDMINAVIPVDYEE